MFRLDPIRRLRIAKRDELRGELAAAYEAADKLANEREKIQSEMNDLREAMRLGVSGGRIDVERVLDTQRYELVLKTQQADLASKQQLVEQEAERRLAAVAEADRDVRVLDKLEERDRKREREEAERRETKAMDEVAGVQWRKNTMARQ